ncbi:MAG: adenylate cyclase, partial [Sulfurovaceae bacterium]|nr:adenylate cyclase [Sulfurovaceae bacterium]
GHLWELDIFEEENKGLIVAEIELDDENEEFVVPEWATTEVSSDPRYTNASLSQLPYSQW